MVGEGFKPIKKILLYKVVITTKTGMLIGGPENEIQIGGIDKVPIQYAGEPYIPGSSIKGKLRSLVESKYLGKFNERTIRQGREEVKTGICNDPNDPIGIGKLFGTQSSASRLIVRDAFLTESSRASVLQGSENKELFYEIKAETAINRRTGTALHGSLRTVKRVIPGLMFECEMVLLLDEEDEKKDGKNIAGLLEEGLELLKYSYVGGSGSRGYGRVDIQVTKNEIDISDLRLHQ